MRELCKRPSAFREPLSNDARAACLVPRASEVPPDDGCPHWKKGELARNCFYCKEERERGSGDAKLDVDAEIRETLMGWATNPIAKVSGLRASHADEMAALFRRIRSEAAGPCRICGHENGEHGRLCPERVASSAPRTEVGDRVFVPAEVVQAFGDGTARIRYTAGGIECLTTILDGRDLHRSSSSAKNIPTSDLLAELSARGAEDLVHRSSGPSSEDLYESCRRFVCEQLSHRNGINEQARLLATFVDAQRSAAPLQVRGETREGLFITPEAEVEELRAELLKMSSAVVMARGELAERTEQRDALHGQLQVRTLERDGSREAAQIFQRRALASEAELNAIQRSPKPASQGRAQGKVDAANEIAAWAEALDTDDGPESATLRVVAKMARRLAANWASLAEDIARMQQQRSASPDSELVVERERANNNARGLFEALTDRDAWMARATKLAEEREELAVRLREAIGILSDLDFDRLAPRVATFLTAEASR